MADLTDLFDDLGGDAGDVPPQTQAFVEENCVHRRDVSFIAKEDIVVPEGVIYDPSLARK